MVIGCSALYSLQQSTVRQKVSAIVIYNIWIKMKIEHLYSLEQTSNICNNKRKETNLCCTLGFFRKVYVTTLRLETHQGSVNWMDVTAYCKHELGWLPGWYRRVKTMGRNGTISVSRREFHLAWFILLGST